MYPAYASRHSSNCEKQAIILLIPNQGRWHHIAVKKLSELLRRISSKHDADFYCLDCLHLFGTKNKTWIR